MSDFLISNKSIKGGLIGVGVGSGLAYLATSYPATQRRNETDDEFKHRKRKLLYKSLLSGSLVGFGLGAVAAENNL